MKGASFVCLFHPTIVCFLLKVPNWHAIMMRLSGFNYCQVCHDLDQFGLHQSVCLQINHNYSLYERWSVYWLWHIDTMCRYWSEPTSDQVLACFSTARYHFWRKCARYQLRTRVENYTFKIETISQDSLFKWIGGGWSMGLGGCNELTHTFLDTT